MSADTIKAIAELIKSIAWALGVAGAIVIGGWSIRELFKSGNPFKFVIGKFLQIEVEPSRKSSPASAPTDGSTDAALVAQAADVVGAHSTGPVQPAADVSGDLPAISATGPIPSDYIYLVHTSFLRPEKQVEFMALTHVSAPHYDIRIKTESYYQGAMDRISYVEYVLHKAFPEPIQRRYSRTDGFEVKEVANGEFVLAAKVYLKDKQEPLVLQRYITLWPSGPRI